MKKYKSLNVLFFIPNTKPLSEIDECYDLEKFYNVLIDVCDYCGDLKNIDITHLQKLYNVYIDIFNKHKGNLKNYFLNIITVQRFELKAYMIFGEDLWKKTRGNNSLYYFLNRGYKYEQAVNLLKERQSLTSKDSFKKRYGDDWKLHFNNYVSKHTESLNSNPNINEINHKKGNSMRYEFYLNKINPNTNKLYTKEEAIEKIKIKSQMASHISAEKIRGKSGVTGRSMQYWINKGLSEDDAKNRVKEIQSTNKIETYIKKYGEQEGIIKWLNRNKRWGEIMQIKRIESGHIGNSYSQSSKLFFDSIVDKLNQENIHFEKIYYGETEFCKWDFENKKPYFYDFVIPEIKLCVEYNGIKFHPKEGDIDWKGLYGDTYEYKIKYDKRKCDVIKSYGFDIIIVWEDDDMNNKFDEIVDLCKKKYLLSL